MRSEGGRNSRSHSGTVGKRTGILVFHEKKGHNVVIAPVNLAVASHLGSRTSCYNRHSSDQEKTNGNEFMMPNRI